MQITVSNETYNKLWDIMQGEALDASSLAVDKIINILADNYKKTLTNDKISGGGY